MYVSRPTYSADANGLTLLTVLAGSATFNLSSSILQPISTIADKRIADKNGSPQNIPPLDIYVCASDF
jgi:hypothetical protein